MANFLHQKSRPILKRAVPSAMVLLYLGFLLTGLYCRCFENAAPPSDHQHQVAQANSETSGGHQHSHGVDSSHPSGDQNSSPHSNCNCDGFEASALVSSSDTASVKTNFIKLLPVTTLQPTSLLPLQQVQVANVSSRGPPFHVPIPIKNQALLI